MSCFSLSNESQCFPRYSCVFYCCPDIFHDKCGLFIAVFRPSMRCFILVWYVAILVCVLLYCHVLMIQPYGISGSPRLFNGDHRDCCDKVGVSEVVNGLAMGSPCVLYFIPVFFLDQNAVWVLPIFMVIIRRHAVILESSLKFYDSLAVSLYCYRLSHGWLSVVLWSFCVAVLVCSISTTACLGLFLYLCSVHSNYGTSYISPSMIVAVHLYSMAILMHPVTILWYIDSLCRPRYTPWNVNYRLDMFSGSPMGVLNCPCVLYCSSGDFCGSPVMFWQTIWRVTSRCAIVSWQMHSLAVWVCPTAVLVAPDCHVSVLWSHAESCDTLSVLHSCLVVSWCLIWQSWCVV